MVLMFSWRGRSHCKATPHFYILDKKMEIWFAMCFSKLEDCTNAIVCNLYIPLRLNGTNHPACAPAWFDYVLRGGTFTAACTDKYLEIVFRHDFFLLI